MPSGKSALGRRLRDSAGGITTVTGQYGHSHCSDGSGPGEKDGDPGPE